MGAGRQPDRGPGGAGAQHLTPATCHAASADAQPFPVYSDTAATLATPESLVLEPITGYTPWADGSSLYPLTRRDSMWSDSSAAGQLALGAGAMGGSCGGGGGGSGGLEWPSKFPSIEISDFSGSCHYGPPPFCTEPELELLPGPESPVSPVSPTTAMSRSRRSSIRSSVRSSVRSWTWSPEQIDFLGPNDTVAGSRRPSPLRQNVVAQKQQQGEELSLATGAEGDGEFICSAAGCSAGFAREEDLADHARTGHAHVCLWGANGPCSSGGFASQQELAWHVKKDHLLACPVLRCSENTFASPEVLDRHLRWDHGTGKGPTHDPPACRTGAGNLEAVPHTTPGSAAEPSQKTEHAVVKEQIPTGDRILKMEMSIGISKKRCREQLRSVVEKRMRKSNAQAGTPRAAESPGTFRSRTPRPAEPPSFPIVWEHGVLPFLIEFLPKWCGPGHVVSVARGRTLNARRICIMTKRVVTRARRIAIAGHVRDLLPDTYHSGVSFVFSVGQLERLVWARGLSKAMPDEVCAPRNPFAYISPRMGDSIGATLDDGDETTATLGPCVMLDGASYWLANFHPFADSSNPTSPIAIEHPSPADRAHCINERHDTLTSGALDFRIGQLTAASGFNLSTTRISHEPYWEECDKEPPLVVTDWILISSSTREANMLRKLPATTQNPREAPVTMTTTVVPGATVSSTGRTSGFQKGQVCEIPAYVDGSSSGNGTGKSSREWYVEEPFPFDNEEEWMRGGIGVEGDSGAAIVDCETNALMGQLWGRNKYHGPGPRWTYFTPVSDIFDDIQERCSMPSRPQLPQYRDDADRWPAEPICRQCFDPREYISGSRRSSHESLMSMIGAHDARAPGENDNDITSVSELATPKEYPSLLTRHCGQENAGSPFAGAVSPASVHAFYTNPNVLSPGVTDLRSPYAQTLSMEDLYGPTCTDAAESALGKRPAVPLPLAGRSSQQSTKRRRAK